ncbi:c-type cytochrome [Candidatus Aalborgicola defluviihabitans]|uniref:c-type cytochrome n=1 Tax=Candidatus Aalborgicola defluviihabitans TaxID=3386187 RepID=UPI001DB0F524|nr:c-type cytochrome [Burkholderiales bacterium]
MRGASCHNEPNSIARLAHHEHAFQNHPDHHNRTDRGTVTAACTSVEVQKTQAAKELKAETRVPGTAYNGWRVFQDKCAGCHGPAATGMGNAPNLVVRMRDVGPRQFVDLVLKRYDWGLGSMQANHAGVTWDTMVDDVMQNKQGSLTMPAWEGEPRVTAHITDLYAYLSARAQGTQGPGRPAP